MQVKDELCAYQMDSTISILRDVAKSGEDRVLQVKKRMSSLARALRNAVISVQPLKRLCDWFENFGAWIDSDWHIRRRKGDCQ